MLKRVKHRFDLHPEHLVADTAYGTGLLLGWLAGRKIAPHILVFDKTGREAGTWFRSDFKWGAKNDQCIRPEGHILKQFCRNCSDPNQGPTGKCSVVVGPGGTGQSGSLASCGGALRSFEVS